MDIDQLIQKETEDLSKEIKKTAKEVLDNLEMKCLLEEDVAKTIDVVYKKSKGLNKKELKLFILDLIKKNCFLQKKILNLSLKEVNHRNKNMS